MLSYTRTGLNNCMRAHIFITAVFLLSGCDIFKTALITPPSSEVLPTASEFVGMNEQDNRNELKEFMGVDPVRIEWCAAFVNSVLYTAGIDNTQSLLAKSYLEWGESTDVPQPGDIMVFHRGTQGWQGHVGFYVATIEFQGSEYFIVLGGNQDQSVSYQLFPTDTPRLVDIRTVVQEPTEPVMALSTKNWWQPNVPLLIDSRL